TSQASNNLALYNSILNMNVDYNGGYNDLGSPVNNPYTVPNNVYVSNTSLQVTNGYNKFGALQGQGKYIVGSVNVPCVPNSDCAQYAMKNQWGNTTAIPSQSNFNVVGNNNGQF